MKRNTKSSRKAHQKVPVLVRLDGNDLKKLQQIADAHNPAITVQEQIRRCVRSFVGTA